MTDRSEPARRSARASRDADMARVERLARLLDSEFRVPGTGLRFGLDGLLGLLPGVGDTATLLMALYLVAEARRLGASFATILRMLFNVVLDWLVGLIPFVGDIFDFGFKCNRRNVDLLRRDLQRRRY
ncbi:DUF4112 domain-containing protein [Minwuia thermotolerans]|uniref:DUF4112 domain-containing protein n=1 Tax=Minwuia thermotolerans TaxID=2056226 RepID=A0A2M9FZC7_9PROT|nr:DUF4112 domain-containing protein [Minwuia thermotolerans]PJK28813.1 DUF4112 domain-containing protein [Minwuia thermotolerans]